MDKFLYLTRSLSRTKRKNYENYVVNAVYFRVGNQDLYPISQQCVKAANGKFYYIDLYFPQLKIAIECDEAFHARQKIQDMLRELDIIRKLTALDVLNTIELDDNTMGCTDVSKGANAIKADIAKYTDLTILRIDVSKSYEEVETQINDCVNIIKEKIAQNGLTDIFGGLDPAVYFKNRDTIYTSDQVIFHTQVDVYNTLFGKKFRKGWCNGHITTLCKNPSYTLYTWLPKYMDVNDPNKAGFSNEVSQDGKFIYERTTDVNARNVRMSNGAYLKTSRVVFAKTKDPVTGIEGYRFLGIFKAIRYEPDGTLVHQRTDDKFKFRNNNSFMFNPIFKKK